MFTKRLSILKAIHERKKKMLYNEIEKQNLKQNNGNINQQNQRDSKGKIKNCLNKLNYCEKYFNLDLSKCEKNFCFNCCENEYPKSNQNLIDECIIECINNNLN